MIFDKEDVISVMAKATGECEPKLFDVRLTTGNGLRTTVETVQVLGYQHKFVSNQLVKDGFVKIQSLGVDYGIQGASKNHPTLG